MEQHMNHEGTEMGIRLGKIAVDVPRLRSTFPGIGAPFSIRPMIQQT
jgi:hypothetical protein